MFTTVEAYRGLYCKALLALIHGGGAQMEMNFMSCYHSIFVMSIVILRRLNLIMWDIVISYSFL